MTFRRCTAHPRSRGENCGTWSTSTATGGSSPLTRGKLAVAENHSSFLGLIPAHAGKTPVASFTYPATWAHPRSRGENNLSEDDSSFWRGSSPLTRGKLCRGNGPRSSRRLIPAHAGKTILTVAGAIFAQAHPRSRGENRSGGASPPPSGGSSPLTRGKLHARGLQSARSRLIPAHVGKTSQFRPRRGWSGAHPRSRGENANACIR